MEQKESERKKEEKEITTGDQLQHFQLSLASLAKYRHLSYGFLPDAVSESAHEDESSLWDAFRHTIITPKCVEATGRLQCQRSTSLAIRELDGEQYYETEALGEPAVFNIVFKDATIRITKQRSDVYLESLPDSASMFVEDLSFLLVRPRACAKGASILPENAL